MDLAIHRRPIPVVHLKVPMLSNAGGDSFDDAANMLCPS